MLRQIFNPHLSDRRGEGNLFVGLDPSEAYLQRLRRLLEEEVGVRQWRKDHFFSKNFAIGNAGPLFPASWSFAVEVEEARGHRLDPRFIDEVKMAALKPSERIFDKAAEDGLRFRIYRHGEFEVRTVQEHDGEESIG